MGNHKFKIGQKVVVWSGWNFSTGEAYKGKEAEITSVDPGYFTQPCIEVKYSDGEIFWVYPLGANKRFIVEIL